MPGYRDDARPAQPSPMSEHHGDRLLYRPEEAAKLLAIGRAKLYALIGSGEIASLKIGGSRRITPAALDAYITQQMADDVA